MHDVIYSKESVCNTHLMIKGIFGKFISNYVIITNIVQELDSIYVFTSSIYTFAFLNIKMICTLSKKQLIVYTCIVKKTIQFKIQTPKKCTFHMNVKHVTSRIKKYLEITKDAFPCKRIN